MGKARMETRGGGIIETCHEKTKITLKPQD